MTRRRRRNGGGRRGQGSGDGVSLLVYSVAGDIAAQRCLGTDQAQALKLLIQSSDIDHERCDLVWKLGFEGMVDNMPKQYGASIHSKKAKDSWPLHRTEITRRMYTVLEGLGLDINLDDSNDSGMVDNMPAEYVVSRHSGKVRESCPLHEGVIKGKMDIAREEFGLHMKIAASNDSGDCHLAYESYVETTTPHDSSIPESSGSGQVAGVHDFDSDSNQCQLFVKVLQYPTMSIQMESKASIRQLVKSALQRSQIYVRDSYVQVDGKIIELDSLVGINMKNATFIISPRIRGGFPTVPRSISHTMGCEPLHEYILRHSHMLFDVVRFTDPPCRMLPARYFVALGKFGRKVYKMLFTMIELLHAINRCLVHFTIWDIVYVAHLDCLVFYDPKFDAWSTQNYRRNIFDIGSILESYFRYSLHRVDAPAKNNESIHEMDQSISKLPAHLHLLVDYIKGMPRRNEVEDGLTPQWRSVFLLDPSGMSSAEKIALTLCLDLKVKYLSDTEKNACAALIGGSRLSWMKVAESVPVLKDVLLFKLYDVITGQYRAGNYEDGSNYFLWLLGRNYLSHSMRKQMDLKAAEAMFCHLFIYLLPLVVRALIRQYRNPAVASGGQNTLTLNDIVDRS